MSALQLWLRLPLMRQCPCDPVQGKEGGVLHLERRRGRAEVMLLGVGAEKVPKD